MVNIIRFFVFLLLLVMKQLSERLLKVEWTINIYLNKKGSHLVKEILLNVTLQELLKVVSPHDDDPLLYDGYALKQTQLKYLEKYATETIVPDLNKYCYYLVCGGIYE